MVNQTRIARTAYDASATQNFRSLSEPVLPNSSVMRSRAAPRPEFCIKRNLTLQKPGAQGRIRTSVARKERQIYSLLPLTARPPVLNSPSFILAYFGALRTARRTSGNRLHVRLSGIAAEDMPAAELAAAGGNSCRSEPRIALHSIEWSWRRDLNPRPSDYKSDALPG
jgi:hypothetical protein